MLNDFEKGPINRNVDWNLISHSIPGWFLSRSFLLYVNVNWLNAIAFQFQFPCLLLVSYIYPHNLLDQTVRHSPLFEYKEKLKQILFEHSQLGAKWGQYGAKLGKKRTKIGPFWGFVFQENTSSKFKFVSKGSELCLCFQSLNYVYYP